MGWISFLKMLLAVANAIANIIRDKEILNAGEAIAINQSMKELSNRLEIGRNVQIDIEAMPDKELNRRLGEDIL